MTDQSNEMEHVDIVDDEPVTHSVEDDDPLSRIGEPVEYDLGSDDDAGDTEAAGE